MKILQLTLVFFLLVSCNGSRQITTGTERVIKDSTIVRPKPVQVKIDGAVSESPEINYQKLDSMFKAGVNVSLINAMLQGKQDPGSKMSARIQVDEKGNLKAICELQEQLIELMTYEIERLRTEYERVTVQVSKTWYQQLWHDFKQLIVGALIFISIVFIKKLIS